MTDVSWHTNKVRFNGFVIALFLAHFSQFVWTLPHPLLTDQLSPAVHIPPPSSSYDSSAADESSSEALSSSSDEMIGFEPTNDDGNNNKKETREIHGRVPEVGGLLDRTWTHLFRFLYTRQPQFEPTDDQRDGPSNDVTLLESNNLLLPHGEHGHLISSSDIEDQNSRIDTIPLPPPPPPQISPPNLDENGEDETKIIKSKTMIIVPDRACPPGKRRDIRGYCRTVIRFVNSPSRGGPIRYYYRKFVSVPTLHFILP